MLGYYYRIIIIVADYFRSFVPNSAFSASIFHFLRHERHINLYIKILINRTRRAQATKCFFNGTSSVWTAHANLTVSTDYFYSMTRRKKRDIINSNEESITTDSNLLPRTISHRQTNIITADNYASNMLGECSAAIWRRHYHRRLETISSV